MTKKRVVRAAIAEDVRITPAKRSKGRVRDEELAEIELGLEEFEWERREFGDKAKVLHGLKGTHLA